MKGAWILVLGMLVWAVAGHGGPISNSIGDNGGLFTAKWIIYEVEVSETEEVGMADFYISAPSDGWVAIGFGNNKGWKGADVVVGYANNVTDRYAESDTNFEYDVILGGVDNIEKFSFLLDSGTTLMNFTRKLNTKDKYDYNLERDGNLYIKWAYGKMNGTSIGYATSTTVFDEIEMSFFGMGMEDEYSQLRTHGILMVFVVMVLMVAGLILSRYMKLIFYYWFYVHAGTFLLSLVFIISSTVIVFQAHGNNFEPSWHSAFGIMFIIVMGLQCLIGFLSHFMFDKKRQHPPLFPDKLHWWFGRLSFLVGMITILLGLNAFDARRLAFNGYYAWVILIFFLVLALERYVGQTHEVISKGIDEDDEAFSTREEVYDSEPDEPPRNQRSISRGPFPKQVDSSLLVRILGASSFAILLLFIIVAIGINTTED